MLDNIKTLLGIDLLDTSKDTLLNLLIDRATEFVKDYCNIDDTTGLETIIEELVILRYNKLSYEGKKGESLGSYSVTFEDDIPVDVKKRLNRYRKVRWI